MRCQPSAPSEPRALPSGPDSSVPLHPCLPGPRGPPAPLDLLDRLKLLLPSLALTATIRSGGASSVVIASARSVDPPSISGPSNVQLRSRPKTRSLVRHRPSSSVAKSDGSQRSRLNPRQSSSLVDPKEMSSMPKQQISGAGSRLKDVALPPTLQTISSLSPANQPRFVTLQYP